MPDDLSIIEPLPWEACPFMPEGCRRATAPWAQEANWGYGSRLWAHRANGVSYYKIGRRRVDPIGWEAQVWRDDVVLGAWMQLSEGSQCSLNGPQFRDPGDADLVLGRQYALAQPVVLHAPLEDMMTSPVDTYQPTEGPYPALTSGLVMRTESLLVFHENEGHFTAFYPSIGKSYRPDPPGDALAFADLSVGSDAVYVLGWNYALNGIWSWRPGAGFKRLRGGDGLGYNALDVRGSDMAWVKSEGFIDQQLFEKNELWAATTTPEPNELQPRKIADLEVQALTGGILSLGEGWVAVYFTETDTRLYHLTTGEVRRLPLVEGISYLPGPTGVVITGDEVWVNAFPTGSAGNDVRWVTVFKLDALPGLVPAAAAGGGTPPRSGPHPGRGGAGSTRQAPAPG